MKIWTNAHRKFIDWLANKGKISTDGDCEITGLNGQLIKLTHLTELVDLATAAGYGTVTITCATSLPANSMILSVNSYIKTVITADTGVSWGLGISGHTDHYGTGLAFTAGTTTYSGAAGVAAYQIPHWNATAAPLLITGNAGHFHTGVVRIDVWCIQETAPTS